MSTCARHPRAARPGDRLASTLTEERVKMSWVTLDRICQEKVDKEGVRSELVRNGRPLRSSAEPLSDDELLAKLRDFGLDVDRDGVRYAFLARRVDQTAAVLAVPEVAWTAFATVLSTAVAAKKG
jgi:hypothetical protein